ncbi:MAG: bifunctional pyr operon transcriptional regulator/uracil phosphoribosyltransferase PyrR [Sedimentisphaerales bacterium]|jgi:pyrimidine operon attenuation protein/uracil phosphoribosyltransferase|nr:bifunctional pyr operon transcriptional regulator/uracil phosphoribosyltransferase PyrR [Sedimentisphaerales bacterium]
MKVLLDRNQIENAIRTLADRIAADLSSGASVGVIGIRSRGEVISQRLARLLSERLGQQVPCGTLDITLYRDDLNCPRSNGQPQVRTTDIPFNVDDRILVLVDDVLFTGRSVRAALDALIDLGRPKAIRLAVLVDRQGREFPIQADYVGLKTSVAPDQRVYVRLAESDGTDEVVVD